MKKVIFALAAVVALAACSKEEAIRVDRQAIAFGDAFVENSTRADYSSTLIDAFKVYGTVTGNGNTVTIYNGADVTRGTAAYGEAWTCGQTEYWIPSASYNFQAVVDGEIADGKIASTADVDKMSFTFAVVDGGFTIKATNGSYMGSTANSNELKTSTSTKYVNVVEFQTAGDVHIKGTAGTVLRYNKAATNGTRFRYYKSTSYTSQQPIHLYKLVE